MKVIVRNVAGKYNYKVTFQYTEENKSMIYDDKNQIPLTDKLMILASRSSLGIMAVEARAEPLTKLIDIILLQGIPPVKTEITPNELIGDITRLLQNDNITDLPKIGIAARYIAYTKNVYKGNKVSGFHIDGYLYGHPIVIVKDPELYGSYNLYTNSGLHLFIDIEKLKVAGKMKFKFGDGTRLRLTRDDVLTLTQIPLPTTENALYENARHNLGFDTRDLGYHGYRLFNSGILKFLQHKVLPLTSLQHYSYPIYMYPVTMPTPYVYEIFSQLQ